VHAVTCATVNCGDCGFQARIEAQRTGRTTVRIRIFSDCEALQRWAPSIATVDWRDPLGAKAASGDFWQSALRQLNHRSCPVPMAVLKTIEVEIGAARPVDVHLRFCASANQTTAERPPHE
jgi:hypothetical protein